MSKVELPKSWRIRRQSLKHHWCIPFIFVEWLCEWISYFLGNWAFLQILEYLGRLSIVIAVIFFFLGHGDRLKTKHYQAWQVINLAQGKPGEGGRTAALEDLCKDGVSLSNIDLSNAIIPGVFLKNANLSEHAFVMQTSAGQISPEQPLTVQTFLKQRSRMQTFLKQTSRTQTFLE